MTQPRRWLAWLITSYQRAGGGRRFFAVECNFTPTCSEFTRLAVLDRGIRQGVVLGWQRIRRCNTHDLPHAIKDPYPTTSHSHVCSD